MFGALAAPETAPKPTKGSRITALGQTAVKLKAATQTSDALTFVKTPLTAGLSSSEKRRQNLVNSFRAAARSSDQEHTQENVTVATARGSG